MDNRNYLLLNQKKVKDCFGILKIISTFAQNLSCEGDLI